MATDGPTPPPCDREIFTKGEPVCAIDGRSNAVERWVKAVAAKAKAKIDWHYSGGRAQVLHLGNAASRERVLNAINELESKLDGRILQVYGQGAPGLYREGVTSVPDGAIAADMDPLTGNARFIVKRKK